MGPPHEAETAVVRVDHVNGIPSFTTLELELLLVSSQLLIFAGKRYLIRLPEVANIGNTGHNDCLLVSEWT